MGFGKLRSTQDHATVATCRSSGSGRDNFIGIKASVFFKRFECRFLSPVDIGSVLMIIVSNLYIKRY